MSKSKIRTPTHPHTHTPTHGNDNQLPLFDPQDGATVAPPPGDGPGFWAGAPSAVYDEVERCFVLCYRLRRPLDQGRGYRLVVARSDDGLAFEPVWTLKSRDWGTPSLERAALLPLPGGAWRLYVSSVDPADNRWRIDLLEAAGPDTFAVASRRPVMTAASTGTEGVKDPVAWLADGLTWILVPYGPATGEDLSPLHATGNLFAAAPAGRQHPHPTALAVSEDGVTFRWLGDALLPGGMEEQGGGAAALAWDHAMARASAIVSVPPAWHLFYDGRTGQGDIYEDRTGLAISRNGRDFEKVTRQEPLLASPWGTGCLRYLAVVPLPGRVHYYYECCRPDGAHELRRNVVVRDEGMNG